MQGQRINCIFLWLKSQQCQLTSVCWAVNKSWWTLVTNPPCDNSVVEFPEKTARQFLGDYLKGHLKIKSEAKFKGCVSIN